MHKRTDLSAGVRLPKTTKVEKRFLTRDEAFALADAAAWSWAFVGLRPLQGQD